MLVYKDGITRTIEEHEVQKFKDLGYIEISEKGEIKAEPLKVEESKGKRR